ncbi:ABC transporter substrate-binding protein [Pandoraea thiooxydans]|uniref:Amino acid ABC transporter substrate-binding protein n=2 Tax=Pandoraea thiooxydans TaxID=445709 RepID=A0A0G3EUN6_9BURK|nr:amino acid ABC transporter substrate-binding protein [Pandoraea thiooxydans]APR95728.1 ABC transporter substrate-binding protein [Pandoraea thiooxydans]
MLTKMVTGFVAAAVLTVSAHAAPAAPSEIKIGTLYASSGAFAAISMPVYSGLKFWVEQKNAEGGVFVKPYNKKIPIKLVAYDDQSNTATAATLYNQLITQDKVDLLVADSGSVLTSVAVPIAREHKMLLIDQTGTGASFFTKDNPYIVLTADPVSSIWPKYVADFLTKDGAKMGVKRVALLYATNDFTGTQATAVRNFIKAAGSQVKIVYDQGVPTSTTNYTVLINNIKATNPDAVVELGYPNNDIAFLRNLQDSGVKFNFVFNIYSGLETSHLLETAGAKAMQYTYTYVTSSVLHYKPEFGMGLDDYRAAWEKKNAGGKITFGFNAVAGYTTGLVLENALAKTPSMDQLALRKTIGDFSGKLKTLDGTFQIDEAGAQIGEITPLGQVIPDGKGGVKFTVVYPPEVATGKPIYPAPQQ